MKVEEWLEDYLETSLDPISVNDRITDDSYSEICNSCPNLYGCEDGTIYYKAGCLYAYYHLDNEPADCFHFIDLFDDEPDFDIEDMQDSYGNYFDED